MNNIVTTKTLCDMFSVTSKTIENWRKRGMPHFKINERVIRYNIDEVMKWIEENNK